MAYTYDNFVTAATGAGLMDKFTDDDLKIAKNNPEYGLSMVKLQQDLQGSTTTEQKLLAQEAMNQLRKSYGSFGSTPATVAGSPGSFAYGNQNAYQKALEAVTNPGSFSYDMTQDPTYSAMKKSYLREGDRSRADTLAQVSAATGGTPSSYAITAAQHAGDYYSEKLADQIPTLEQNAYQRYLAGITQQQAQLEALQADRAFDYNLYLQNYEQEQQKYANALALYQMLGYATPEVAKILGISTPKAQTTETGSGGSGGGGGKRSNMGDSTGSGGGLTVDMNSVLALGYGPISESRLNELVASGEVSEVVKGNKITFEKVKKPSTPTTYNPLWDFDLNMMNKANSSTKSNPSTKSGTGKTSNTSSTKKIATGGAGRGSAAGGLKSQLDRVALLM